MPTFRWRSRTQLLGVRGLATKWQVRLLMYSSERLNTRATHIQCCPRQARENFGRGAFRSSARGDVSPKTSLLTELETRLLPALPKGCFKRRSWATRNCMVLGLVTIFEGSLLRSSHPGHARKRAKEKFANRMARPKPDLTVQRFNRFNDLTGSTI
jgi:hypothetical protein